MDVSNYVPDLLRLVKRSYPDWNNFTDPKFVEDEEGYKREASQLAKELLSREALSGLLAAEDYEEFIGRLKKVAGKTNLLFLGVPQRGDLALISSANDQPGETCAAIFELLYGENDVLDRLQTFFDFVNDLELPQKWTFPTYYLFLLYPESEVFVKPSVMGWFSKELDGAMPYSSKPDAAAYGEMRQVFHVLRDELGDYGARDMIDVQSFVWVAKSASQKSAAFDAAVERLRNGLEELDHIHDLAEIERQKGAVIGRYGEMFAVENLPHLSAEDFRSFLRFENNRHWTGIGRYGSRLVQDMPKLREALTLIQDESRPLSERYDDVRQMVKGLGKAALTPVLLVTHPEQYGVWNAKLTAGLNELNIYPDVTRRDSEGTHYAEINDLLVRLAEELEVDLWTLDILWDWIARHTKLAEPFATIFENREQAEWAFDLFAETVERLGGSEKDERFALTIRHSGSMMRLNFGNWMLIDVSKTRGLLDLALLTEPMKSSYDFNNWGAFAGDNDIGVFEIPIEVARAWPPELQSIYEASMEQAAEHFKSWKRSPYRNYHRDDVYQALFDEELRENVLSKGLTLPAQEQRFWRITLPTDIALETENGRRAYDLWQDCLRYQVAAIDFDDDPQSPQVARFTEIRPGDKVVAFLRNKRIGGIGEVTSPLDERVAQERPVNQDYFHGNFWLRIGVDWEPKEINVDALPVNVRNKFGQGTVLELSEAEFEAVEKVMAGQELDAGEGTGIAREFTGFTADAFDFMAELQQNNNKQWMAENRGRWKESVREPMRALFADLGPSLKERFDPFLVPDALEIRPTAHQVLARINKNWAATADSLYHEYYWGAFYREGLSRQTDAQLFINLNSDEIRFGFFVGEYAKDLRDQFRRRVLDNPEVFFKLADDLKLMEDFEFVRTDEEEKKEVIEINSAADMRAWVESGDYDLLQPVAPEEAVILGSALADCVFDALRRVFPVYLWAVADDPETVIERYLATEFAVEDEDLDEEIDLAPEPYEDLDFLEHTYLTSDTALELQDMLMDRKQAIFFGPPGTGKTFVAKHLGRLVTGLADPPPDRMEIIQFHPAYSYEDFIEGIRPESKHVDGRHLIDYPALPGVFVRFCRRAQSINEPCVFIIDEINRGNIARIFGELMLLLEYRDQDVPLPYSGKRFRIPENVYIIGTMNTADRSIALVDFALRRRFHFFHFAADPDLFDRWLVSNPTTVPYLGELYRRLSQEAIDDPHFAVGPSYFMQEGLTEGKLQRIWRRSILPYLEEYYFDQPAKAQRWQWDSEFMRGIRVNMYGS